MVERGDRRGRPTATDGGEPTDPEESADSDGLSRRRLLTYGGAATLLGAGAFLVTRGGDDGTSNAQFTPTSGSTGETDTVNEGDDSGGTDQPEIAERYAPTLYFGRYEKWYPTDPRPFENGDYGERGVVHGFDALDGYTEAFSDPASPPAPTVWYRVLRETSSSLAVVQYWLYSAFDQFTVNFHWHDWELLQVFVDTDSDEPVLLSASAHSRKVPNNEHLDPAVEPGEFGILAEVGSHSSATEVNGDGPRFQRFPVESTPADVTNAALDAVETVAGFPLAYGLPRDEGGRLPYVLPELDGAPIYEHDALPNVDREDLVAASLTVRDLADLTAPPGDLPAREEGLTMHPAGREADSDDAVAYDLRPIDEAAAEIDSFTGPQLSFEFAIPQFVEDQFASHLTSTGVPWEQARYDDPFADVTDPAHRRALADRFSFGESTTTGAIGVARGATSRQSERGSPVVGRVLETVSGTEGELRNVPAAAAEEMRPEIGVSVAEPRTEAVCRLEDGDPVASTTTRGVVAFVDAPDGDHRLVVNGPGYAPYAQQVGVEGGPGQAGELPVVARESAVKLRGELADGTTTTTAAGGRVERVRITDDYAGPVFDGRPVEEARFGVYVHGEGTYSVEYVDDQGQRGAARVSPAERGQGQVTLEALETGKGSLSGYLVDYLFESARLAREYRRDDDSDDGGDGPRESVASRFDAAARSAERALGAAREGRGEGADDRLRAVGERLASVRSTLEAGSDRFSETVATVLLGRVETAEEKIDQALESGV